MEHRLILGGEQWLPFARSRVRALKALGLQYVAQKFEIEGCTVEVRIEPGIEHIRIVGGGCVFKMDSGLIDSEYFNWSSTVFFPQNYTTGVYYDTTRKLEYDTGFTDPFPKAPATVTAHLNPGKGSSGQFTGTVTKTPRNEFKGSLPVDTKPMSFSPGKETKLVGSEEQILDIEFDENLKEKKRTVNACPASIFTGRTRLYVQALYGTHVYDNFAPEATPKQFFFLAEKTFQFQPVLTIDCVKHSDKDDAGEPIVYPNVDINTSSGVYLDKETGNHWLFNISDGEWLVYPLIANACGEQARKYLKDGSGLGDDDKHHLEAYILSSCRPDSKKKQSAAFSGKITYGSSLGYGWHWNELGTVCDMAVNRTVPGTEVGNGRINKVLESTHFSMAISKTNSLSEGADDFKHQWSASLSVVSGPTKWCTDRSLWAIAHPAGPAIMEKLIPDRNTSESGVMPYPGEGTFYVFYKGNERQVCKVKVEYIEAVTNDWTRYTSSNTAEIWRTPFYISMNIRGWQGSGFIETYPDSNAHFKVTHTIGNVTIGPHYSLKIDSGGIRKEVSGGSLGAYTASYLSAVITVVPGEPWPYPYPYPIGIPIGPMGASYHNREIVASYGYRYGGGYAASANVNTSTFEKSEWGRSGIVIPQGDSQAIFASDDQYKQVKLQDVRDQTIYPPGDGEMIPVVGTGGENGSPIYSSMWYDAESLALTARVDSPDQITETHPVSTSRLYCAAGAIDTLPDFESVLGAIAGNVHDDYVLYTVPVISGTKADSPVLSKTYIDPQGTDHDVSYPVLVGWI